VKKITVDIEGRPTEGEVAFSRGVLWIHLDGETFTYEAPRREGRRGGGKGSGGVVSPGEVIAPMPGKIVKILVQPGERVVLHQVLLVMEAMKMEYTLKAQIDGLVTEIGCEAGQQVALGQILAKLETPQVRDGV